MQNTDNTLQVTLDIILHLYEMTAGYTREMTEQDEKEIREKVTITTTRAALLSMALGRYSGINVDGVIDRLIDSSEEKERAQVFGSILEDFNSIPGKIKDIGEVSDRCLLYVVALIVIISGYANEDREERLEEAILLSCTAQTLAIIAAGEGRALQSTEKAIKYFAETLDAEQMKWLKKLFDTDNMADRFKEKANFLGGMPTWYTKVSSN